MASLSEDQTFMQMALDWAAQSGEAGEVPVGAVVVKDGRVIGAGRNSPVALNDPSAHAEVMALRAAAATLGNYRLDGCTLYVTLEPCAMCSGAIFHARIQRVVYGAAESKTGCAGSVLNLFANQHLNHQTHIAGGVLAAAATAQLQAFFQARREKQRALAQPLRQDALRTPDACFAQLPPCPWPEHFVSDLPALNGLRMHYMDVGPEDASSAMLLLHPIPGWSQLWHEQIAQWVEEGARVLAPDLIGFGKSDKPKRVDWHTPGVHTQSLLQLVDHLDIEKVTVVHCEDQHPLLPDLIQALGPRVQGIRCVPIAPQTDAALQALCDAPYPDAGHRAAEKAFGVV